MNSYHTCPTCNNIIITNERYPTQICDDCYYLTLDKDGNGITFANEGIQGGFISVVGKTFGQNHQCFVNGIECYADEGRFGGIVIEALNN